MAMNDPNSTLPFEQDVREFLADGDTEEVSAGFLVTKIVDEKADLDDARYELERITGRTTSSAPQHILDVLKQEGFHGEQSLYKDEAGNNMAEVIRTRAGIPISLGLVAIAVAKERNVHASGVLFPSHFLIQLGEAVVDPYVMEIIDYEHYVNVANQRRLDAPSQPLSATPTDIATRMLKNLQSIAIDNGECLRAFEYNDYLNLIHPESFHLALDRSNIWQTMGDYATAKAEAVRAMDLAPNDSVRQFISRTIDKSKWGDSDEGFN